jgi:hypothetical protein
MYEMIRMHINFKSKTRREETCKTMLTLHDDLKMNHKLIGCECINWNCLAHDRGQWWAPAMTQTNFRLP